MRRKLLVITGASAFYNVESIIADMAGPVLWFRRNEYGEMMLNFQMPTVSKGSCPFCAQSAA
jgi:hypothetical protein